MKNQLYYGDNLEILRNFVPVESVDLCYIDPPFNSAENYNQTYMTSDRRDAAQAQAFIDTWTWDDKAIEGLEKIKANENQVYTPELLHLIEGMELMLSSNKPLLAYLIAMTQRIAEIYRVLKPTGSFYLHCDPTASHYLKLVCDALFCSASRMGAFQNEIVWKRTSAHNDPKRFGRNGDRIFFYTKSKNYTFNPVFLKYDKKYLDNFYKYQDEIGKYRLSDLTGAGRTKGESGTEWRGYNPTTRGRHWAVPSAAVEELVGEEQAEQMTLLEKLDLLLENNLIVFSQKGVPSFKRYLDKMQGVPAQEIWVDISPISSRDKQRLGYPTQKPEALLERIIAASSNEGDVVLDAFCGCGTTIAVAEKMNRKWIGIDITYQAISLILKRLEDSFGFDFTKDIVDKEKQVKIPAKLTLAGVPKDWAGYKALATNPEDKARKEFEKLVILQYSNNRAMINEKKGADRGIDGLVFIKESASTKSRSIIFSVKSGSLTLSQIRELRGVIERENAAVGILISLENPSKAMYEEAKSAGTYHNDYLDRNFDKLQIVTVQDIIDGKRMDLPIAVEVVKSAELTKKDKTENLF